MSRLSVSFLRSPQMWGSGGQARLDHSVAGTRRLASAVQSCFSFKALSPGVPDRVCRAVPDTLLEKHCKQILITLVAAQGGERHILLLGQPIFQLRVSPTPPPPALSKKCPGGHASHGAAYTQSSTGRSAIGPVAFPPVPQVTASDSSLSSLKLILRASVSGTSSA